MTLSLFTLKNEAEIAPRDSYNFSRPKVGYELIILMAKNSDCFKNITC